MTSDVPTQELTTSHASAMSNIPFRSADECAWHAMSVSFSSIEIPSAVNNSR